MSLETCGQHHSNNINVILCIYNVLFGWSEWRFLESTLSPLSFQKIVLFGPFRIRNFPQEMSQNPDPCGIE